MSTLEAEQIAIRCSIIRSGTSKGIFLLEGDIPPAGPERDTVLLRLMGTPDVLQIDGLGGSHLITSKIAVVGPPTIAGADVDYLFAQVDLDRPVIDFTNLCGNISAGVGPFAIDAGLVRAQEPVTTVRIHNVNTGKIILAHVPVSNGKAKVKGDFRISGVPGGGAEIFMDYSQTTGAKTGEVLPTGHREDVIHLESGESIRATICDVATTIVFCRGEDLGMTFEESPEEINRDERLVHLMREVRGKAAQLIGFCKDWRDVDEEAPLLPLLYVVAVASDFVTLSGERVSSKEVDVCAKQMFFNRCHEAMAGSGSMCVAAASRIEGSIVNQVLRPSAGKETLSIGHPSGIMTVQIDAAPGDNAEGVTFRRLGFGRTARKLMDGVAYIPA